MTVDIQYTRAAEKFFTQHEDVRAQYETAILKLVAGEHPESVDVKKIQGKRNDYYRIRIGSYRVIYAVINGKIVVITTLLAGPRVEIYKKMQGLK